MIRTRETVTEQECLEAIQPTTCDKSPGLDGLSDIFFIGFSGTLS